MKDILRIARKKKGLSQIRVAKILKYSSPQFISNWERGVSLPPVYELNRLADLYKVSVTKLKSAYLTESVRDYRSKVKRELKLS